MMDGKLRKVYRAMLYVMPAAMYFSFRPWLHLGTNETMNFELSLTLIWLVLFDALAVILLIRQKKLREVFKKWRWLLLPLFLTLSLLWSHDTLRGVLIGGVMWLVYLAVFSFAMLKAEINDEGFRRRFWRVFFGTAVAMCGWCLLQCILDVAGVSAGHTLICAGCTYQIFGFPHPNGFAAEPQFMGNLLLAPVIMSIWIYLEDSRKLSRVLLVAVLVATLFLTLSRGAIYAFMVAMVVMSVMCRKQWRQVGLAWLIIIGSFVVTLNIQGLMAECSKTNDTYLSGVNKVINQLTLGIVDLGGRQAVKEEQVEVQMEESMFDGYIEVSTNERVNSWEGALKVWSKDVPTVLFGVGLGSAPLSMYENGALSTSKEIINNQYVSLLLESGMVGIGLVILSLVLVVRALWRSPLKVPLVTLVIVYMISLCFFSGLPNALHVYLLPALIWSVGGLAKGSRAKSGQAKRSQAKGSRKKLVS